MSKDTEEKVRFPNVRDIDKSLLKTMEDDAKQRGFPDMSAYIREALKHFTVCKESEATQAMKPIVTKFPGHCLKCGNDIEKNSWALYGKGVGLVCMDCFISKLGDKTLIAKYIKNRELDRIGHALKEECDKLAGRVEELRVLNKMEDLKNQQENMVRIVTDYLKHNLGTDEERKALEETIRCVQDGKRIILDMDEFIKAYVRNRKWRKQIFAGHGQEESPQEEGSNQ